MARWQHYAYVASGTLLDKGKYRDSVSSMLMGAIRQGEDIAAAINLGNAVGMGSQLRKFSHYGKRKYHFPPPSGGFVDIALPTNVDDLVKGHLATETGLPVTAIAIVDLNVKRVDEQFWSMWWLQQNWRDANGSVWNYDKADYVWNGQAVQNYPITQLENGVLKISMFAPLSKQWVVVAQVPEANVPLEGKQVYKVIYEITQTVTTNPPVGSPPGTLPTISTVKTKRLWFYDPSSHTYPDLDFGVTTSSETFTPVVILQRDKQVYKDISTECELTTRRLMKRINMDPEKFLKTFNDVDTEKAEKYDIFIHFGLAIDKPDSQSEEYAYLFFKALQNRHFGDVANSIPANTVPNWETPPSLEMKVGGDNGYVLQMSWYSISDRSIITRQNHVIPPGALDFPTIDIPTDHEGGFKTVAPRVFYKWTTSRYLEVVAVYDYRMGYVVNTNGGMRYVDPQADKDPEIYIPLHDGLLRQMSMPKVEKLAQKSLRGTMFLVQSVKLKWYQTGFFKFLALVIVIVLIVAFQQYQLAELLGALLSVSVETATAIIAMGTSFIASYAAPLFGDAGWIFMLVVAFALNPMSLASMKEAFISKLTLQGWGTGMQLLNNVLSTANTISGFYTRYEQKSIEREMAEFNQTARERDEALQEAYYEFYKDVGSPMDLDALIGRYSQIPSETPNMFYARTLNANPGVKSFDMVSSFVGDCLELSNHQGANRYSMEMMEALVGKSVFGATMMA